MTLEPQGSGLVGHLRPFVQLAGLLRKELVELLRQPRLLLVLVVGPFLVLLLFAVGYDQEQVVLRTAFVGPDESIYEETLDDYAAELQAYISNEGYSTDVVEAQQSLADGEIDLVVIFPPDPGADVLAGRQAVVSVLHDKLDPIQQTAVVVSAEVAIAKLNAAVLERVLVETQDNLVGYNEGLDRSATLIDELDAAVEVGDQAEADRIATELRSSTGGMTALVGLSESVSRELRGNIDPAEQERVDEFNESIRQLDAASRALPVEDVEREDVDALRLAMDSVGFDDESASTLDPAVLVRPFRSDAENILRVRVGVSDFFAPSAIALLLQHMVLTFAALGLVSDRTLGLFEVFRVAPIGAGRVLIGKYLAYTLLGSAVGAILIASVTLGLDVPMRGSVGWLAVGVVGMLIGSIGLGAALSLLARTSTQAVQYAMLALLSGLFFSGFFLSLDAFRLPVRLFAGAMPVTYGVRLLRDVMLRGLEPASADLIGIAATSIVYAVAAWALLHRQLKVR